MSRTLVLHGQMERLSSFSLVNRRLAAGLSALGYQVTVMPSDVAGTAEAANLPGTETDIYLAHDHPYDLVNAPGKANAFFLEYDYARILRQDAPLVERLNHFFDVVLVPSEFVRAVCKDSGIRIPIALCPLGFDPSEFHPKVPPVELPTKKRFKFLYLGGANERKGTDLLLRAYVNEFRASDEVVLVLKAFAYPHLRAEFERQLARVQRRRNVPEILYEYGDAGSVAGYYAAADCGVFPFRGEGFGLPILESIACGCPVIVTGGGGPRDFCSDANARFIPARQVTRRGKPELAPDVAQLQVLLREAYERGAFPDTERARISCSVADWTWQRTVERIDAALQEFCVPRPPPAVQFSAPVCYAFYEKGETSWRKDTQLVDRALAQHFTYVPVSFRDPMPAGSVDVVLGESGYALEPFLRAARLNPGVKRILRRSNAPFEVTAARSNREREVCGLAAKTYEPMAYWRNARECALADVIVVPSRTSQNFFLQAGYAPEKLRVIPLGMPPPPQRIRSGRSRVLRFLFIGTDPFRKGIRLLFEAWDALQPRDAELVCIVNSEVLQSPLLLKYLVRNPGIKARPLMSRRALAYEYAGCDCQVLPSLEDGFPIAIAEGMSYGKPAIVSQDAGIGDVISHLQNGYLVPTGSASKLKQALAYFCSHREKIVWMGAAAAETAHEYSRERFQQATVDLVQSHLTNG